MRIVGSPEGSVGQTEDSVKIDDRWLQDSVRIGDSRPGTAGPGLSCLS